MYSVNSHNGIRFKHTLSAQSSIQDRTASVSSRTSGTRHVATLIGVFTELGFVGKLRGEG
jgi:hypothetical protein